MSKTRDKKAAPKYLGKLMKRHGRPERLVTDGLKPYEAAPKQIGAEDRQVTDRWANNRAAEFHQFFRKRETTMQRFRRMRCLHKFAALRSSVCNRFNTDRRLSSRPVYEANRAAALVEQRALCAGWHPVHLPKARLVRMHPTPLYRDEFALIRHHNRPESGHASCRRRTSTAQPPSRPASTIL